MSAHPETRAIPAHPEARAIRQDNVLLIGPFPEGGALEDPGAPGALAPSFRHCNIALLIAWPGVRTPYPRIARLLHAQRVPFSLLLCAPPLSVGEGAGERSSSAALGAFFPLEDPSPCWRCLELRWLGWCEDVPAALSWLESLQHPDLCGPPSAVLPSEEMRVLLSWAAMDVLGSDAGVARLVLDDGTFRTHTFLPHPQCAWCSPWSGVRPRGDLQRPSFEMFADTRLGAVKLDDGLALPASLEMPAPSTPDPLLLTALRLGASVAPRRIRIANPSPYLEATPPPERALIAGLTDDISSDLYLDAIALYGMGLRAGRPLWRGTQRGVAMHAPDPRLWMSPLVGPRPGERLFHETLELDWARAHDLHTGEVMAVPADLALSGPPRDRLAHGDAALATAHPRLTVSVRWALSRVAENDGLMAAWYVGAPPPRIDPRSLPADWSDALREIREAGAQIEVLDLTTDFQIPVVAVVGRTADRWFYGCGASWQPERALRAAWGRAGRCALRRLSRLDRAVDFLFEGPVCDFPETVEEGVTDPIDTWRARLEAQDRRGLWIDISPPDVAAAGVAVARAWVEGALPRPPAGAPLIVDTARLLAAPSGVRLLELPVRLGRSTHPLPPSSINRHPHPFI